MPPGEIATDPDPVETGKRDVELASGWDATPAGIVGFAEGGWTAVELAATHGDLVERLVLISTPVPERERVVPCDAVSAKTLLLYGSKDPAGGHKQAAWWKANLGGRIEIVPGANSDILADVWPRVLSHLAPRSLRK
ncbi:MAG TPA: alpha/beta hydrolase [Gaiellaceae bacterium]|nr:alpha/beta hydrolase [Gaiellaceae bacterium]